MPPPDLLVPFFIASAIFACVPGPGMLYAAAQTIAAGRRAGWLSALGFHAGGYVHICAAAFGLAILLKAVPILFVVVKLAGAAYLIWIGFRYLRAGRHSLSRPPRRTDAPKRASRALIDSFFVEVLNPKTALFYIAFLPQFTDTSAPLPVWAQIMVLGIVVNFMFSLTDAFCVLLSGTITRRLSASDGRIGLWTGRLGGSVLVGLGVNLALARQ